MVMLKWISEYLSNCCQTVRINSILSNFILVIPGTFPNSITMYFDLINIYLKCCYIIFNPSNPCIYTRMTYFHMVK